MKKFCLWSGILSLALIVLANVLLFKSSSPYLVVFAESPKSLSFSPDVSETFTTRISVSSNGVQANASSYRPFVSADGRYVAFESWASNLIAGDNNETKDIFVHDRDTGQTTCVSAATDGTQASGESQYLSITTDGRYVTFNSEASNLITGDSNGTRDIFIHDRQSGETNCVSVASDGTLGNDRSRDADVSADGRYVAFDSRATNLTSGDTNATQDIFVHDRQTGQTTRVSIASDGTQANNRSYWPYLSADGQYVAFYSYANNLVVDDTNGYADVFVHNRQTGKTTRVSVASDGTQANDHSCTDTEYRYGLDISADGRYVVFASRASNLVINDTNESWDIFVRDLWTHQTTRVSVTSAETQGNADSTYPSISADGQYIAFTSNANNLAVDDTNGVSDVFVHNRETGETRRISVDSDGTQGNALSKMPSISGNGHYVAFSSDASNLVDGDTNAVRDIFVHKQDITYQAYLPFISNQYEIPNPESIPLLQTNWGQRDEYAQFSPDNLRLGCWSTAIAQILYFHRLVPSGNINYQCSTGYAISEDFDTYAFDWSLFVNGFDENTSEDSINEVAKYVYFTSVIIQKDYGTGTYVLGHSERADAVAQYYGCNTALYSSSSYPMEQMKQIIVQEINASRPVMMHIRDLPRDSYHAVVIDAYREESGKFLVHINMGWEGNSDGWYDFDNSILNYDDTSYKKIITIKPK